MEPKCFTIENSFKSNKLISKVQIAIPVLSGEDGPPEGAREFQGLWDTGATHSMISIDVANECDLIPTGIAKLRTAGGEVDSPTYLVSMWLPNFVCFPSLPVALLRPPHDLDLLIGMDIIGRGDFAVTNFGGETVFTFRWPSQEVIDFVKETKKQRIKKRARKYRP